MNPIAFEIFGISVHWYGLIIAFGLLLAVLLACLLAPSRGFKREDPLEWILWVFPLAIIGARLYYIIYNNGPWGWEAFAIWNGGIAIYGGIIGGAIGLALYCWIRKKNFLKVADVAVPCLILGQSIGRWGNFVNQEAYGNLITNTSQQWFPFAVQIDSSNFTELARQQCQDFYGYIPNSAWFNATFFYESMASFITCIILIILVKKVKINGIPMCGYFILYGISRFIIEGFRTDSLMWGSMRVSQVLSLILIIAGIGIATYLIIKHIKSNKVVVIGANNDGKLQKRK